VLRNPLSDRKCASPLSCLRFIVLDASQPPVSASRRTSIIPTIQAGRGISMVKSHPKLVTPVLLAGAAEIGFAAPGAREVCYGTLVPTRNREGSPGDKEAQGRLDRVASLMRDARLACQRTMQRTLQRF
jgi:hypothetical protein